MHAKESQEGWILRRSSYAIVLVVIWATATQAATLSVPDQRAIPLLRAPGSFRASGVVVSRGIVLTAAHSNTQSAVHVFLPAGVFMGRPMCQSEVGDIGILETDLPPGTPAYSVSLRIPRPGEKLTIAGWPGGRWTVVTVAAIGFGATSLGPSPSAAHALFTTLAPGLGQGMSGAPVLDAQGKLLGIHSGRSPSRQASVEFLLANGLGQCTKFLNGVRP